jgi:y4mF family transcriptional regulator
MLASDIAKTIRSCRKRSGLTQLELAKMAGVGKTVVFDIENGKETVQMNSLLKILEVLNIRFALITPFEK